MAGRVQTQTGQALAAAQITVGDAKGQSDAQGQFAVPGLPPGQYTVTVTAIGYQKQTRTVTLDAGETERLVVVMPRLTQITPYRAAPKTP
ncbi:MAG: carboxypeptidase-like regulatory domain-containing protein [Gemmatimonadales bacterium]